MNKNSHFLFGFCVCFQKTHCFDKFCHPNLRSLNGLSRDKAYLKSRAYGKSLLTINILVCES